MSRKKIEDKTGTEAAMLSPEASEPEVGISSDLADALITPVFPKPPAELPNNGGTGDEAPQPLAENTSTSDMNSEVAPALPAILPPASQAPQPHRSGSFYQTDFRRVDRNLSEAEQEEWNAIYASFRSGSMLTGTVVGIDQNELQIRNSDTGILETRTIYSLVIICYRVKILIPENAVWAKGEERPQYTLRGMIGATVDYVVTNVDREGECCLASRTLALVKRRRAFKQRLSDSRFAPNSGDILKCSLMVVGSKRCLVSSNGYDVEQRTRDMSYASIIDMREVYRPGQEMSAGFLSYDTDKDQLALSVKLAEPHPFIGAVRRHPVGQRRQATITGKYAGGVFCTLPDGAVIQCLYSNRLVDSQFLLGDSVIVHIARYDYNRMLIFGRIVTKW